MMIVESLEKTVRSCLDNVYAAWLREELDRRLKGHLEAMIATAIDETTKQVAKKLLELAVRETK